MSTTNRGIILAFLFVLLVFFAVRAGFQTFVVEGSSMDPSMQDGQVVMVNKAAYWFYEPHRGDIVVYRSATTGRMIIHRIVGLPRETVQVINGVVCIDGNPLTEPYAQGTGTNYPEVVLEGSYFILGDNRNGTLVELVPQGDIVGKAWLCIWPLSDWGFAPNYSKYALKPSFA